MSMTLQEYLKKIHRKYVNREIKGIGKESKLYVI